MERKNQFLEWMRKINNVYMADDRRMAEALEKIHDNPCELNED